MKFLNPFMQLIIIAIGLTTSQYSLCSDHFENYSDGQFNVSSSSSLSSTAHQSLEKTSELFKKQNHNAHKVFFQKTLEKLSEKLPIIMANSEITFPDIFISYSSQN